MATKFADPDESERAQRFGVKPSFLAERSFATGFAGCSNWVTCAGIGIGVTVTPASVPEASTMDFASPDQAAEHLAGDGIQVWSGDFYAPNAIDALGLTEQGGVLRTGLMSYNTTDEVKRLLTSLTQLAAKKPAAARA